MASGTNATIPSKVPYPVLVDSRAASTPQQPYVCVPRNPNSLDDGHRDFTYAELAVAVDRMAWWLDEVIAAESEHSEERESGLQTDIAKAGDYSRDRFDEDADSKQTLAYLGITDLRYIFVALAAMKTKRKLLIPSFTNSREAQLALVARTRCKILLATKEVAAIWEGLQPEVGSVRIVIVPEFDWFTARATPQDRGKYPFDGSWEEVKHSPCLVMHTSGTTGLPKPIYYTQHMLSTLTSHRRANSTMAAFKNNRFIIPVPLSWSIGLGFYIATAFGYNLIPIMLPANTPMPPSAEILHRLTVTLKPQAYGAIYIPSIVKDLVANPTYFDTMKRNLKALLCGGAPLDLVTGNRLMNESDINLLPAMGSTEVGGYGLNELPERLRKKDWMYCNFPEGVGWKFVHFQDDLYECIIEKSSDPAVAEDQMVFYTFPGTTRYETRDLWIKHPEVDTMWKSAGRIDDFCKLASLTKWNAAGIEASILAKSPRQTRAVVMGGDGRTTPFLIVEAENVTASEDYREEVWKAVEQVNFGLAEEIRLRREMILFLAADQKLARVTNKGSVNRRKVVVDYQNEIESLYS